MTDTLYSAIQEAIARPLDGTKFEQCAVELLREFYPRLRPVEGGNDAGMDGVGELNDGIPFFLVATVKKDVRGNLERSVKSHIEAGGERRVVVLATSRRVTGRRWIQLGRHLLETFNVRLAAVHDRSNFIDLLYGNAVWRRELLGVSGVARALSRLPATRRATPEIPLIGRDRELVQLKAVGGDVVVSGKPGIGKTYLLQHLMEDEWGLFDNGWHISQLEDAIRDMQPSRVVIDDAHLLGDRLTKLRQLRSQMGADFAIAAVTWPGSVEEVLGALPSATCFDIGELERDQILNVIKEMGIMGPNALLAHLVNQAHGRVGLAVTLAQASLTGGLRDVATGDVLRRDLVSWYARSVGTESRYILGFLALSGHYGATFRQVGKALDLNQPRVAQLIRGLASGGTLDEAHKVAQVAHLRVQPEDLRYALVRDVYLSGAGSLDLNASLAHLDDPRNAANSLLGAIRRGAELDHEFVLTLISVRDSESVIEFALLGTTELQKALELWPQFRDEIIRQAHFAATDPDTTLPLLLESAVGDHRPEHSTPEHPLRVIDDVIASSDRPVEVRKAAIESINRWLEAGGDVGVGIRAVAHVMRPQRRFTSVDPGLGNTFTLSEGPLPPEAVTALTPLWDRVLEIVAREKDGPVGSLIAELHYWVYPRTLALGGKAFEDAESAIRGVAPGVIKQLSILLSKRPGMLQQLKTYGAQFDLSIEIPADFQVLFPEQRRSLDIDYYDWERTADAAVVALAQDVISRPLDEQVDVLHGSELEANAAGISYPRFTPRLAQLLADSSTDPLLWIDMLVRRRVSDDLVLPFLLRSAKIDAAGWQDVLVKLLGDDSYSWIALRVILTQPVREELKAKGISTLDRRHGDMIEWMIVRGEIGTETAERLLDANDPIVARDSAIALTHGGSKSQVSDLSEAGRTRWREVIIASPPDEFWCSEILKNDHDLFASWIRAWYTRLDFSSGDHWLLPHTLIEGMGELPVRVRRDIIEAIPVGTPSYPLQDVVVELVGADLTAAKALLDRSDLKEIHWVCLRRGPSETWMERALMALDRGWNAESIAAATEFSESTWMGEESQHWNKIVDAYSKLERLGDERRSSIIDAGVKFFSNLRDRAADRERKERVFGLRRGG